MGAGLFRKIITIAAMALCLILIADGIYKILVIGTNDWGLIIVGVFFLIAVGPDVYEGLKK